MIYNNNIYIFTTSIYLKSNSMIIKKIKDHNNKKCQFSNHYKFLLFYILLFLSGKSICQNNFEKGFKVGFKNGYCYKESNCIAPICPIPPVIELNESLNNYSDGYDRGFVRGRKERKMYDEIAKEYDTKYQPTKRESVQGQKRYSEISTSKFEPIINEANYQKIALYKANRIYNTAREYQKIFNTEIKTGDSKYKDDIYRASLYLNQIFVQGVRIGDAERYLSKAKKIYKKAVRKYNKRIKQNN